MEKTFKKYVANLLIDKLGSDIDISDVEDGFELANLLMQEYNIDRTITYSREESKQIILKYFEEFGDIIEKFEDEIGEKFPYSPFSQIENFVCCAAIITAENLLANFEPGMTNRQVIVLLED